LIGKSREIEFEIFKIHALKKEVGRINEDDKLKNVHFTEFTLKMSNVDDGMEWISDNRKLFKDVQFEFENFDQKLNEPKALPTDTQQQVKPLDKDCTQVYISEQAIVKKLITEQCYTFNELQNTKIEFEIQNKKIQTRLDLNCEISSISTSRKFYKDEGCTQISISGIVTASNSCKSKLLVKQIKRTPLKIHAVCQSISEQRIMNVPQTTNEDKLVFYNQVSEQMEFNNNSIRSKTDDRKLSLLPIKFSVVNEAQDRIISKTDDIMIELSNDCDDSKSLNNETLMGKPGKEQSSNNRDFSEKSTRESCREQDIFDWLRSESVSEVQVRKTADLIAHSSKCGKLLSKDNEDTCLLLEMNQEFRSSIKNNENEIDLVHDRHLKSERAVQELTNRDYLMKAFQTKENKVRNEWNNMFHLNKDRVNNVNYSKIGNMLINSNGKYNDGMKNNKTDGPAEDERLLLTNILNLERLLFENKVQESGKVISELEEQLKESKTKERAFETKFMEIKDQQVIQQKKCLRQIGVIETIIEGFSVDITDDKHSEWFENSERKMTLSSENEVEQDAEDENSRISTVQNYKSFGADVQSNVLNTLETNESRNLNPSGVINSRSGNTLRTYLNLRYSKLKNTLKFLKNFKDQLVLDEEHQGKGYDHRGDVYEHFRSFNGTFRTVNTAIFEIMTCWLELLRLSSITSFHVEKSNVTEGLHKKLENNFHERLHGLCRLFMVCLTDLKKDLVFKSIGMNEQIILDLEDEVKFISDVIEGKGDVMYRNLLKIEDLTEKLNFVRYIM